MTMTDDSDLKILIADDEPLAAERLQMLLARIDGVHLVGTAHVHPATKLGFSMLLLSIAIPLFVFRTGADWASVAARLPGV